MELSFKFFMLLWNMLVYKKVIVVEMYWILLYFLFFFNKCQVAFEESQQLPEILRYVDENWYLGLKMAVLPSQKKSKW